MSQKVLLVCDSCGREVSVRDDPDLADGWLDVHPIATAKTAQQEIEDAAMGSFCSYQCLILWAAVRQAQRKPVITIGVGEYGASRPTFVLSELGRNGEETGRKIPVVSNKRPSNGGTGGYL